MGNSNGSAALVKARIASAQAADEFAQSIAPTIASLHAAGVTKLRDLAAALNRLGINTVRDANWHVSNVKT